MAARSKDVAFWSKISRKYAAGPIRNMNGYLNTLERTKSYLNRNDNVLEVGCGTGSTALLLAPHVSEITATDLAPGMIEIAKERLESDEMENVKFEVAEILEHTCDEEQYDAILAHNLLHLVADLDGTISHLAQLTRPGGLFISKTVCAPRTGGVKYALLTRIALPMMQALGKAPFVDFLTPEELEQKILMAGFDIVETQEQAGMLPSLYIVARKT